MDWARMTVSDGIELAYTERGAGPPVVLVPGWTMSGEVFEHQLAELSSRFRMITFDPRSTRVPFANVIRRDWLEATRPWLTANVPDAELATMESHLGFWDRPREFNAWFADFLDRAG